MSTEVIAALTAHGIQPSAQRVAVATFVLGTDRHPSAEQVWAEARRTLPQVSRATVYNTLNLFVRKGLLRQLVMAEGRVVFDARTEAHHHFIDEISGRIYDVPWDSLRVSDIETLEGFQVDEYQVVMRGRKTAAGTGRRRPDGGG